MSTLKKILSITKPSDMTTEHVMSQIVLDEQQRIRESGTSATAFFAKFVKRGKGKNDKSGRRRRNIALSATSVATMSRSAGS